MSEQQELREVFEDLEREAHHPSAEEIAAAIDGAGGRFASSEILAHAGWCSVCAAVAAEYREFAAPAPQASNADWAAFQRGLPARSAFWPRRDWLAAAAGFLLCAGLGGGWIATRPVPEPRTVTVEKQVEVRAPVRVADAAVVDLFPEGSSLRSTARDSAGADRSAELTTFLFHPGSGTGPAGVRLVNRDGRELWEGTLTPDDGVYSMALDAATLRQGPLTAAMTLGARTLKFRIPARRQ